LPAAGRDQDVALGDLDTEVKLALMKKTPSPLSAALLAALLLAPAASVNAQSRAVAPKAAGKLMTKEELRDCMKLHQSSTASNALIEHGRLALGEQQSPSAPQPDAAFTDAHVEQVKIHEAWVESSQ
jgi:hypothetical protein